MLEIVSVDFWGRFGLRTRLLVLSYQENIVFSFSSSQLVNKSQRVEGSRLSAVKSAISRVEKRRCLGVTFTSDTAGQNGSRNSLTAQLGLDDSVRLSCRRRDLQSKVRRFQASGSRERRIL